MAVAAASPNDPTPSSSSFPDMVTNYNLCVLPNESIFGGDERGRERNFIGGDEIR